MKEFCTKVVKTRNKINSLKEQNDLNNKDQEKQKIIARMFQNFLIKEINSRHDFLSLLLSTFFFNFAYGFRSVISFYALEKIFVRN